VSAVGLAFEPGQQLLLDEGAAARPARATCLSTPGCGQAPGVSTL
jgi:hypothetical protein